MDFFSSQRPPSERTRDGQRAHATLGVGLEARRDDRVGHRAVLGEVPVDQRAVVVGELERVAAGVRLGLDGAIEAVESPEPLHGRDGDVEARGGLGGGFGLGAGEDAAAEVGRERSRHGANLPLSIRARYAVGLSC